MSLTVVRGGKVYDPAHAIDGEPRDLWIRDGVIVPAPENPAANPAAEPGQGGETVEVIDAAGLILAPGAIEIHSHIAGWQLSLARAARLREAVDASPQAGLIPELIPSPAEVAEAYLKLGYTTLFDAAMSPRFAWYTHADFSAMQSIDRGAFTLASDDVAAAWALGRRDPAVLRQVLAGLLDRSGGYAIKLVNPGVGLAWKQGAGSPGLETPTGPGGLAPREWIGRVAAAVQELGLPHPVHVHAGNLGRPGSWRSLVDTIQALEGAPAHLCHIQFYAYADPPEEARSKDGNLWSAAEEIADAVECHPELTFDAGLVVLGPAHLLSADIQAIEGLRRARHKALRSTWMRSSIEGEGCFGLMPFEYAGRDADSAVQWAIGLELLLRSPDPGRLFMTCDYPNGGSFTAYPRMIKLLMDRAARQEVLQSVHPAASRHTGLPALEREYSLGDVVAMTSLGPARALGLADRGHLGAGAKADIRCYRPQADREALFAHPAWVMKDGQIVVREGALVQCLPGRTLVVYAGGDSGIDDRIIMELDRSSTQLFQGGSGLPAFNPIFQSAIEVVPCRSAARGG